MTTSRQTGAELRIGPAHTGTVFELVEYDESAAVFHARAVPPAPTPQLWWNRPTGAALVLGSTQRDGSDVDAAECERRGVDIVRRRSGGGAVLLTPGEVTWIDVIIPTGSAGWSEDVHGPMVWFGQRFAAACRAAQVDGELSVHAGTMITTDHSSLVCFDGVGPGEVLLDGNKLLGISQRRNRDAARLQCCWYHRHDHADLIGLLPALGSAVTLASVATLPTHLSVAIVAGLAGF